MEDGTVNPRTCIVTRQAMDADLLLRFVADPDGMLIFDLKRKLPGRGVWVGARKSLVEAAAARNLFARSLKRQVTVSRDLAGEVELTIENAALSALAMANKAGLVVTGFGKVEAAICARRICLLLHATNAAKDGIRKLAQAERRTFGEEGVNYETKQIWTSQQMDLALGRHNVVHAAAMQGGASRSVIRRIELLENYRSEAL